MNDVKKVTAKCNYDMWKPRFEIPSVFWLNCNSAEVFLKHCTDFHYVSVVWKQFLQSKWDFTFEVSSSHFDMNCKKWNENKKNIDMNNLSLFFSFLIINLPDPPFELCISK